MKTKFLLVFWTVNSPNGPKTKTSSFSFNLSIVGVTIPSEIIAPLIELIEKKSKQSKPDPIEFYITSPGGYLTYCFDKNTWKS